MIFEFSESRAARSVVTPRRLALAAMLLSLGACARHTDVTGSIAPLDDYRERHPIILTNAPKTLDIFATRGPHGLDLRQYDDVRAFAADYKAEGRGILTVALPQGPGQYETQATLAGVRKALSSAGVSGQYVNFGYYHPADGVSAAPIRLSFSKFQAKVDSHCGQWTTDFNGAATAQTFRNQSPPNFGCAYQSAIAAQVANPTDLVRPRQEGPIDVLKRSKDIEDLRQHKDPSTQWSINAQQVGSN